MMFYTVSSLKAFKATHFVKETPKMYLYISFYTLRALRTLKLKLNNKALQITKKYCTYTKDAEIFNGNKRYFTLLKYHLINVKLKVNEQTNCFVEKLMWKKEHKKKTKKILKKNKISWNFLGSFERKILCFIYLFHIHFIYPIFLLQQQSNEILFPKPYYPFQR